MNSLLRFGRILGMIGSVFIASALSARAQEPAGVLSLQQYLTISAGGMIPRIDDFENSWNGGPLLSLGVDVGVGEVLFLQAETGGGVLPPG